jgi:hypothetical protein
MSILLMCKKNYGIPKLHVSYNFCDGYTQVLKNNLFCTGYSLYCVIKEVIIQTDASSTVTHLIWASADSSMCNFEICGNANCLEICFLTYCRGLVDSKSNFAVSIKYRIQPKAHVYASFRS